MGKKDFAKYIISPNSFPNATFPSSPTKAGTRRLGESRGPGISGSRVSSGGHLDSGLRRNDENTTSGIISEKLYRLGYS